MGIIYTILGLLVVTCYIANVNNRGFGINLDSRLIWHSGSNNILFILLIICCIYLIAIGIIYGKNNKDTLTNINRQTGRLISDFYILFGETS